MRKIDFDTLLKTLDFTNKGTFRGTEVLISHQDYLISSVEAKVFLADRKLFDSHSLGFVKSSLIKAPNKPLHAGTYYFIKFKGLEHIAKADEGDKLATLAKRFMIRIIDIEEKDNKERVIVKKAANFQKFMFELQKQFRVDTIDEKGAGIVSITLIIDTPVKPPTTPKPRVAKDKQADAIIKRPTNARVIAKVFCITGALKEVTRAQAEVLINKSGGKLVAAINRSVNYLVTNNTGSGSVKNIKAHELGIEIITEKELYKMLGFVPQ